MQISNTSFNFLRRPLRRWLLISILINLVLSTAWSRSLENTTTVHELKLEKETSFAPIDLGVVPLEISKAFTFALEYEGTAKAIVEAESECSCLQLTKIPESFSSETNTLDFSFTPNGVGAAQVNLQLLTLDLETGAEQTYTLPVNVVGFDPAADTLGVLENYKLVSPSAAYQELASYRVIDVRGIEAYEKARIPKSFSYSLEALIAKQDLLKGRVLLVGESVLMKREESLLRSLAAQATDLHWLEGGLSAWLRQGLPIAGIWPSSTYASTISLSRWLESGASDSEWLVVDLSGQVPAGELFFGHEVLRIQETQPEAIRAGIISAMEATLRKPQGRAILVIGDSRELVYPLAEKAARGDRPIQVFYLKNGVLAYHNWKRHISAPSQPQTQTISLTSSSSLPAPGSPFSARSSGHSGCSACPKKR